MDHNTPYIDKAEESEEQEFVKGEDPRENVVWQTLRIAIKWMKGMRSKRCGYNPLVMRLVDILVYAWMVF